MSPKLFSAIYNFFFCYYHYQVKSAWTPFNTFPVLFILCIAGVDPDTSCQRIPNTREVYSLKEELFLTCRVFLAAKTQ